MTNSSSTFQTAVTANVDEAVEDSGDNGLSWFTLGLGIVLAVTGITGEHHNTTGSASAGPNGGIHKATLSVAIQLKSFS